MTDTSPTQLPDAEFKVLLREAIPHMRAFARGLTRDPHAADDLAQDALLRAWDRRAQFRAQTNFRAWVMTIVRNQFYSDKRRSWRQVQLDDDQARETLPAPVDQDEVMAAWAGLGYYARARNLHRAAITVCHEHGGRFPDKADGLRDLPGIGPYTAGAVAAIAFGERATVVDGNIERVLARYFAISTPLPAAKAEIGARYHSVLPRERPSDFPQALMDFANAVCTPRNPGCLGCPLADGCAARAAGTPELWPVKAPKKQKRRREGVAFVARDEIGQAFMMVRPETGMLGGMSAFPSAGWTPYDPPVDPAAPLAAAPFDADWRLLEDRVEHVFTHFALTMQVAVARIDGRGDGEQWKPVRPASLPTLMRKVWKLVQDRAPIA